MNKPIETPAGRPDAVLPLPHSHAARGTALRRAAKAAGGALLLAAALAAAFASWSAMSGHETTEDAYVDGNVVQVTPQVAGTVTFIAADNTDLVAAGQPLVRLDRVDAELALSRAESLLARAVRAARVQYAAAGQMQANLALRRADLDKAQGDLGRRRQLSASGGISGEDMRHAEQAVSTAAAALAVARQQQLGSEALVDGTTVWSHPDVLAAASRVRDAYVGLQRTELSAPVGGVVTRRNVQLGQRVAAGAALMSVVPLDQLWISANFKEAQLRHIRVGQAVRLTSDLYGDAVRYTGRIVGQDAGTGSAFSLLPAQNATGNWIKVVQRVPVRILLDAGQLARHPLKLGLSMKVDIDIRSQAGPAAAPASLPAKAYRTEVFAGDVGQAERRVRRIIQDNGGGARPAS